MNRHNLSLHWKMDIGSFIAFVLICTLILIVLWSTVYPRNVLMPMIFVLLGFSLIAWRIYSEAQNVVTEVKRMASPVLSVLSDIPLPGATPQDFESLGSLKDYLDRSIDKVVDGYQNISDNVSDINIVDAVRDAMSGGKRLRSALTMDIANIASQGKVDATPTALAMEQLHNASLVIDDLPYFDNDMIRRGAESIHAKYGPAVAQMAATALTSLGLDSLNHQGDVLRQNAETLPQQIRATKASSDLTSLLSDAMGIRGASGGQLAEQSIVKGSTVPSKGMIKDIMDRKTGSLFEAAMMGGWIVGNSLNEISPSPKMTESVRRASKCFGRAYQLADDITDVYQDNRKNGGCVNYCSMYGRDEALRMMEEDLETCRMGLDQAGLWSPVWEDTYRTIWDSVN